MILKHFPVFFNFIYIWYYIIDIMNPQSSNDYPICDWSVFEKGKILKFYCSYIYNIHRVIQLQVIENKDFINVHDQIIQLFFD